MSLKSYGHTCNNTLARTRVHVTSLITSVSTMHFLIEIKLIFKAMKSSFQGSYDKRNLTLVVISYEIDETRRRLVS